MGKGLKKHRALHAIRLECPVCKEFRPGEPSYIVVKLGKFITYYHEVKWDGATVYLDKSAQLDRKEKIFYEIECTGKCMIRQQFSNEEDLPKNLKLILEGLSDELAKIPPPPGGQNPTQGQKVKKCVFKLVKRNRDGTEDEATPEEIEEARLLELIARAEESDDCVPSA